MNLLKAIQNGEGKNIEFKVELPNSNTLAKTVVAFSNTGGGKIIIGINDQGKVVGLKPDEDIFELQDKIASIIYETCYPNVIPEIYTMSINDSVLLVIEVFKGSLLPYYLKNQEKNEGVYILLGKFEHVTIKCSRFKGITMDVFLDRKEYEGDLFTQLENAEHFIKNHISLSSEIKGLQRLDQYELPLEAIRESLVNAVIHRDYSNIGRDIKIGIYDDMVNIVSPGAFPSTITQEDILEGRSEIRNKVIARVFKELNYIEQWGSGIRRIKSSCIAKGLKEPQVLEKGDFVDVSLYRSFVEDQVKELNEKFYTNHENAIVKYLTEIENKISTKNASDILRISDRATRTVLNTMVKKRILQREGSGPQTHYKLIK